MAVITIRENKKHLDTKAIKDHLNENFATDACVCVCLRLSTMKTSSVWIRWDTREQINYIMLKTLNSFANSPYRCFMMQSLTFN